ncbi:MAG: PKD domain-containing protein [Acidobacteriota bacterium]|nr:PKD domain-containing protein [Acidobacteriota bacterium]
MRKRNAFHAIAAAVLLVTAGVARAQCVPAVRAISQTSAFPNLIAGPIATTGSTIGVAKSDTTTGAPAIFFATYDADLNPLTADRQIAVTSASVTALLWNGSEFALFYQLPNYVLMMQRIDTSGNPIGAAVAIMNHPWGGEDEVNVVWSPSRGAYGIARTVTNGPDRGVWLTVVSRTGSIIADSQLTLFFNIPAFPRAAALPGGGFAVTWIRTSGPLFLSIVPVSGFGPSIAVSDRTVSSAQVATDGNTILVIFASGTISGMITGTELRSSQFDLAGNRLTPDAPFLTGSGTDVLPLSLQWNPALGEWALTYNDAASGLNGFPGEIRLRRFRSLSDIASDTLLSPDPVRGRLNAPYPIVFMNGAYYATIQRLLSRVEGSESYLLKLCPFFVTARGSTALTQPFSPVTFTANGSGGTPPYRFEWNFGDNGVATGSVVQHLYSAPGTYTVTLTGTDAAGAVSIHTTTVVISTSGKRRAVRH